MPIRQCDIIFTLLILTLSCFRFFALYPCGFLSCFRFFALYPRGFLSCCILVGVQGSIERLILVLMSLIKRPETLGSRSFSFEINTRHRYSESLASQKFCGEFSTDCKWVRVVSINDIRQIRPLNNPAIAFSTSRYEKTRQAAASNAYSVWLISIHTKDSTRRFADTHLKWAQKQE